MHPDKEGRLRAIIRSECRATLQITMESLISHNKLASEQFGDKYTSEHRSKITKKLPLGVL